MKRKIAATSARSLSPVRPYIKDGQRYRLMIRLDDIEDVTLGRLNLPNDTTDYKFLPPISGKETRKNSEGEEVQIKTGGKETVSRMIFTSWEDWHGHEHSGVVARRYKRWPVTIIPPPEEPFTLTNYDGDRCIVSDVCIFVDVEASRNLRILNLFLEVFRSCEIIDEGGKLLIAPKVKKLSWDLLPHGDRPWTWSEAKSHVSKVTEHLEAGAQTVIDFRMKEIAKYSPVELAVGRLGFEGYFVFGFPRKGIYVLESVYLDNATYVFDKDWTQFSELSKKEIIMDKLHKDRVIHDKGWKIRMKKILSL